MATVRSALLSGRPPLNGNSAPPAARASIRSARPARAAAGPRAGRRKAALARSGCPGASSTTGSCGRLHFVGGGERRRSVRPSSESWPSVGVQILHALGDDMDDAGLVLQLAGHRDEARADDDRAQPLERLRPDDDVGDARLVLERHEDDALGGARALAHQHEARRPSRARRSSMRSSASERKIPRAASRARMNATGCAFSDSDSRR